MSQYEFTRPPIPPNMLLELQKMHAVSDAGQKIMIKQLQALIAGQEEQNRLLAELLKKS